ncbi:Lcl C-terminal domain-containing protein [Methylovulum miyakonense]|uniref:Lcl C-terminal domain-containing protein n=1 Tax=Methylovulum miyakonense TaxID=645578 RepID=UPI0003811EC0|nr:DUF1566 domain-containing protein [Methylovulum miyakonense]
MTKTEMPHPTGGDIPTKNIFIALLFPLLLAVSTVHAALESKLETATCDAIKGWAWNSASPSSRIQVDIYDGTAKLTTLTAQLLRTDLKNAGKGDGQYGFAYVPPTSIRNALTHKLSVRYKGTATELTGSPINTALPCYGKVNDTGWQKCSTNTGNGLNCPLTDYPRQDGEYGRDKLASSGQLLKIGKGSAGFDYTKIANNGSVLAETAALGKASTAWACTRDNLNGLLWEVKTTDGGIRDVLNTYSWYNPNSATNGGFVGYQDNGDCTGSIACDTLNYIKAVNASKLCGKTDWRLPTVEELLSLTDYSRNPTINPVYFPNTKPYWYVSSTIGPVDSGKPKKGLWGVYSTSGYVNDDIADPYGLRIRLVSGK